MPIGIVGVLFGLVLASAEATGAAETPLTPLNDVAIPSLSEVTQLAAGYDHTCAIAAGKVICWGGNRFGQLNVPAIEKPSLIAAGDFHTCVAHETGVVCWGKDNQGLTNPPASAQRKATQLQSGTNHVCASYDSEPYVVCWGNDEFGQIEVPDLSQELKSPLTTACGSSLVAGGNQTIIRVRLSPQVGEDQNCEGWGQVHYFGRLRNYWSQSPRGFAEYSPGLFHECVLKSGGSSRGEKWRALYCHASLMSGNHDPGAGELVKRLDEVFTKFSPENPVRVSSGWYHSCAINGQGGVQCAGLNESGQLDVPANLVAPVTQLAAGALHTCAVDAQGVKCWGRKYSKPRL